jgi:hypothetical protein
MEAFEVRVRRWAEQVHEFLQRLSQDDRLPDDVRGEAYLWQLECEHVADGAPAAWWPDRSEDLP